jgi:hypothetical protein
MFETNPAYEDDEEQMEYIFKENQEVPFEECELILKKNTKIIDLE